MKRAKSIFLRCGELVEQWRNWLPYREFCSKNVRTSLKNTAKHRCHKKHNIYICRTGLIA